MTGHLNSFSSSGVGNLNKNFPKIQMPGRLPGGGGGCLRFHLTDTLNESSSSRVFVTLTKWSFGPQKIMVDFNKTMVLTFK